RRRHGDARPGGFAGNMRHRGRDSVSKREGPSSPKSLDRILAQAARSEPVAVTVQAQLAASAMQGGLAQHDLAIRVLAAIATTKPIAIELAVRLAQSVVEEHASLGRAPKTREAASSRSM